MDNRIYIQFVTHYHIKILLHITLPNHCLSRSLPFLLNVYLLSMQPWRSHILQQRLHNPEPSPYHNFACDDNRSNSRISTVSVPPTVQYSMRALRISLGWPRRSHLRDAAYFLWVTLQLCQYIGYIAPCDAMSESLERIWREAVVEQSKYYISICPTGLRKTMNNLRITGFYGLFHRPVF
jgi:hypothetical protein